MANKVSNKVVVIGTGAVGVSYAYAALNQGIVDELVLIDINQKTRRGRSLRFEPRRV